MQNLFSFSLAKFWSILLCDANLSWRNSCTHRFALSSLSSPLSFLNLSSFLCFLPLDISCLPVSVRLLCSQQQIMRDRWMNVGYEEEELKPYIEPMPDYKDPRRTGRPRNTLKEMTNVFHYLATHRHTWVQMFFSKIFILQASQDSNCKLVVCVQTSCCRWDSLRRRSRTHWWTRSTMMWWLHICYWTIGTLRYTLSFSHLPMHPFSQ